MPKTPMIPKPVFFAAPSEFGAWLAKNHLEAQELWVGYYKKESGKPSLTWPESVDEALCFGWIDGIRKSIDEIRYTIRFTPRKATSNWSTINIGRVRELTKLGRMQPAGLTAFEERAEKKSGIYSYEQRALAKLDAAAERQFRANKKAWANFQAEPPGYRKLITWWVVSAKQEATRQKRLAALIACSEEGRRIGLLARSAKTS